MTLTADATLSPYTVSGPLGKPKRGRERRSEAERRHDQYQPRTGVHLGEDAADHRFQTTRNYREYDVVPGTGKLLMTFPGTRDAAVTAPQPRIHIVQNWTEELKTRVPTAPR